MGERARLWLGIGAMWLLLVLGGIGAYEQTRSPAPVGDEADAEAFSAARAWRHLETVARDPHPVGSEEIEAVRDYLVQTLEGYGMDVEVQTVRLIDHLRPGIGPSSAEGLEDIPVSNVMVRLPGTASTGAVLLATHYDSVWTGPGATDAGLSVAALVETARALTESAPLRNDVIVLLTDAEEAGFMGARAFVDEHPWAGDVEVVLNFEGRGVSGPAVVYQLVNPTTGLIRGLVHHAPNPVTSPFVEATASDSYRDRISDLAEFRRLDVSAIGFAIAGNSAYYHTPLDDPEHASRASMQHMGEIALSQARHFGAVDLATVGTGSDATWWRGVPGLDIVAPAWIAWPMLATLLAIGAAIVIQARARISLGRVAGAFGLLVCGSIVAALVGFVGVTVMKVVSGDARTMLTDLPVNHHQGGGDLLNGPVFLWAFVAAALAATTSIIYVAERWLGGREVVVAAVAAGVVVLFTLAIYHPPSAAHLLIPFLCAAAAALVWVRRADEPPAPGRAAVLGLLGIPVAATFVTLTWLGYLGFTLNNAGRVTASAAIVTGSLAPHLLHTRRLHPWLVPGVFAGASVTLLVVGVVTPSIEPELVRFADLTFGGH